MITLYAFGRVHPGMIGEARDLRAQWALEEAGLPYRVHALDYIAGELDGPAYSRLSCFRQVPVIDDDGFIVGESGAVVLYIAEKAGNLIPADFAGRTQVCALHRNFGHALGRIDENKNDCFGWRLGGIHLNVRRRAARRADAKRHPCRAGGAHRAAVAEGTGRL